MAQGTFPNLNGCSLLTRWVDPVTGIASHVLTKRAAPVQQSFYFTNRSFSADGRYLWFYCAYPPSGNAEIGRTLGVVDFSQETVRCFPDTQFRDGSPFVDTITGDVYWCWEYSVYRRSPDPNAAAQRVNSIPASLHKNRYGKRLATHLTLSSDRREFLIDAHLGREWCIGSLPLDGSDFQLWKTLDRCYNHAQFSPTDPDLALIAQDWWIDVATGDCHELDNRLWLLRRSGEMQAIFSRAPSLAHEWWDGDGLHVWYVDYHKGTERVSIVDHRATNVWPQGTCHSHASADGRYLVGDIGTYSWSKTGCRVSFFNVATGRECDIVSAMPAPAYPRGDYHIDPHPQFCMGDSMIAYTTTVMGGVDVALVPSRDLISATC